MISLVIYGVIAIALAASAGYAFMSFSSSSRQLTQLQENQVQMDTAVAALRASLLALSNNGVAYAPVGYFVTGQAYMQLPATLGVVGAAPWGQPYLYCPVSQTGTSNKTGQTLTAVTVQSSTNTYTVNTLSSTLTQGNSYVITDSGSKAPPTAAGYVAYIVSTLGPGQTMPDCSSITVATTGPSVSGGIVRGVTAGFSFMQRVSASSDRMEIYVGATATGDTSGRDTNNLATMDNAMALWSALQPRLGMIYLENSVTTTSTFNAMDASLLDIRGQNDSLIVETDPSITGTATLTLSAKLSLPAATTFQNLNITGPASIYAYKPLTFRKVAFTAPTGGTALNVYGADLEISDSNFTNVSLYTTNARVTFLNDTATTTGFTGTITANNSSIAFESAPGAAASSYALTSSDTTNVLSGTASNVTIGAPTGATASVTTTGQIALNGGNLTVNSGSTLTPTTTTISPIVVTNGTASIIGFVKATATNNPGIYAVGSSVNISAGTTLNAVTGTGSAIFAEASAVTGGGNLKVNAAANPCIELYSNGAPVPLYITSPTSGAYTGYASFAQAQQGYPPLLSDTTSTYDTTLAGTLTTSTTTGTDPYINAIPVTTVGTTTTATGYLDKTSFEAGVRSVVNQEFRSGLDIYLTGACAQ